MGLDEPKPRPARPADGVDGADLVEHVGRYFGGGRAQLPPSEAHEIGIPGVGTDGDTAASGRRHRLAHRHGIARVKSAGDVRGTEKRQQPGVRANTVVAEPFAQIGVQIDRAHRPSMRQCAAVVRGSRPSARHTTYTGAPHITMSNPTSAWARVAGAIRSVRAMAVVSAMYTAGNTG